MHCVFFKTKKQADRFLHKIYRCITHEEPFWIVKFDKEMMPPDRYGELDFEGSVTIFRLNPHKPVVKTFLHECLHYFFGKDEEEMLRREDELMFWLSNRQLETLLIKMTELMRKRCF